MDFNPLSVENRFVNNEGIVSPSSESKYDLLLDSIQDKNVQLVFYLLLAEEKKPELSHQQSTNLLYDAVLSGNSQIVRLLLTRQPELNLVHNETTLPPLYIAVKHAFCDIAEILIKSGAFLNIPLGSSVSFTYVLHLAVQCAENEAGVRIIEILLDNGADINAKDAKGYCPLMYSTCRREVMEILFQRGAKVNGEEEALLLHTTAFCSRAEQLLPILFSHGINPHAKCSIERFSALHSLAAGSSSSKVAATLLLEKGVPLDEASDDEDLQTPLHVAASNGKLELVRLFLDRGADVNARSKEGTSALFNAAICEDSSTVELLLVRGANVQNKTDDGMTAMHAACSYSRAENIQILLRFGGSLNDKDNDGYTPFSVMGFHSTSMALRVAIKEIAKLSVRDAYVDPLNMEVINNHPNLKQFYGDCIQELEGMKEKRITQSVSLCDLFFKTINRLAWLMQNKIILSACQSLEISSTYPIYECDLNILISKGLKKSVFVSTERQKLLSVFRNYLPELVIDRITYFVALDKTDL